MPKGKKNWAFREIANMLDNKYGLSTEEQLEVAERLVYCLRLLVEEESNEIEKEAQEKRSKLVLLKSEMS